MYEGARAGVAAIGNRWIPMYTVADYGAMIADSARIDAFVRALRQVITRDSVVVDIGMGTGILALLACQLGPRRVYAIEPDEAVHVAREAAANGYADRMECLQAFSTAVTLPVQADVIVSDVGGVPPRGVPGLTCPP